MKKGGKNLKDKEIKIPIRVVVEKKTEMVESALKIEKEKVKRNKIVAPTSQLRIVRDKDNLPVLDGAKFYKEKVKKIDFKKGEEDKPESRGYFSPKIEPEKPKEKPKKDEKDEEEKKNKVFKKEKRIKIGAGLAMMSQKKREKILIASVVGIVSIIFIVWVFVAKNNISHSLGQERKSIFSEEGGLKDNFQELKDKLQEFTSGLKEKNEAAVAEDIVVENNNPESEVIDKLKEKVLIEGVKEKLEEGEEN